MGVYSLAKALSILAVFGVISGQVNASPVVPATKIATVDSKEDCACTKPIIRKEWRTLTNAQKESYIKVVQCLQTIPSKSSKTDIPGAKFRVDDFIAQHSIHMETIHFVGQFLPYHRYFVASYEKALRDECNYTGANPYWDWSLDSATEETFLASPVFDPVTGFGGNGAFLDYDAGIAQGLSAALGDMVGRTGGGCVTDGPFQNWTTRLGPGPDLTGAAGSLCFRRDFSPVIATKYLNTSEVARNMEQPDYGRFLRVLDGDARTDIPPSIDHPSVHAGGHWAVGGSFGQLLDLYISPSDPLFFLHHSNIDRLWWSWQAKKLPERLTDISGNIVFQDYDNEKGGNVTLSYVLDVGAVNSKNATIAEVMDIQGETLCYGYDALY